MNLTETLAKQSELLEKIKSINTNFRKDPALRKTPEYFKQRLTSLEKYWEQFFVNNNKLVQQEDRSDEYFTRGVFEKVKELYLSTKTMIISYEEKLRALREQGSEEQFVDAGASTAQADISGDALYRPVEFQSSSKADKFFEMLNEHKSNIRALQRTIRNMNLDDLSERWQLEDELKTVSSRWETFDRFYWKMDNQMGDMDELETEYNQLEELFKQAKSQINKKLWSQVHQERSTPKIELPTFDGSYSQWTTFKDLFVEAVHSNNMIPRVQKMQHLKAKLRGEAERLVQHLNINSDNYESCWEILQHRYDNLRLIFSYHANLLLNQHEIQQPTAAALKKFHDSISENLKAINNLQIDTTSWDPLLVHIFLQKLDQETTQSFIESCKDPRQLPTMEEFLSYLEHKFLALETSKTSASNITIKNKPVPNKQQQFMLKQNKPQPSYTNVSYKPRSFNTLKITCPNCNKDHGLYFCKEFMEISPERKLKMVERLNVCKNCLFSHNGNACMSNKTCKHCNGGHNTMLHDAIMTKVSTSKQRQSSHVSNEDVNEVLLATAQITVQSADGNFIILRALLDQGSQVTLITEDAVQRLKLKKNKYDAVVTGLGASSSNKCKGEVQLMCKALNSDYEFNVKALVMRSLTNKLPNKSFKLESWSEIENLKLADPQFNITSNIDILLGADIYSVLIMEGLIRVNNKLITAQQTRLGWVLSGNCTTYKCHVVLNNIEQISKFWEQEEITNVVESESQTINPCDKYYEETTTRLTDGRYQVRLPMKPGFESKLGQSKSQAIAQYKQLERKINKNKEYGQMYRDFMTEYEQLGHMKKSITKQDIEYFLPHHGIIREEAVFTKIRVVFNASAKTSTGLSLNDLMENGPNLQADLQHLLLQWRQHKYVLAADIEKMYRFILVHPEDRPLQKIIWTDSDNSGNITEYELVSLTYGTKSAPYIAQKTLKQLAIDEGDNYPRAKPILQNNFYMDDALFGSHSIEEARKCRDELINLLSSGGFNLRKWSSNEPALVNDLPDEMRNPNNFAFTETETSKTLGLGWNPKHDKFEFSSTIGQQEQAKCVTKRKMLSDVAKLFDPLGWLSPVTIKTKILFQNVWLSKIQWEDELPPTIAKEWENIRKELTNISQINVPRWLGTSNEDKRVELHAFCDASEKAFACVTYIKVYLPNGDSTITLVAAKTKVAPINKKQTLPRLELCGAHLLAKLVAKVKSSLSTNITKTYAWTDSMVVLGWLQGDSQRWKQYVSNRVEQIKEIIPADDWNHVRSEQNSADCASRGLLPSQLQQFSPWWEGPSWLKNDYSEYQTKETFTTEEEIKLNSYSAQHINEHNIIREIINKHSSITAAARLIAWILRFITWTRDGRPTTATGHLTLQEIRAGELLIVKHLQQQEYSSEIKDLKKNGTVKSHSNILKLNPFLDENECLRVGGRLRNSEIQYDAKHPLILPANYRGTQLFIEQAHQLTLHGGARLTLTYLRQRYWITGGLNSVKKQLRGCVKCARFNPRQQNQLMGDLPKSRVTPSRPFYHCGVDYAGPFEIKANKGRGIKTCKGYIALFVCMATKAVHLELVSDMSTPTFLNALSRVVSRRGPIKMLFSDCGSNFIGANRELKKLFKENATFENIENKTTDMQIEWQFNAPAWPTAGGVWEAAVKSTKQHLKRVLGDQRLTYEEFYTLLVRIEACLNSRPLTAITENPEDLDFVLTPGHFLIGGPLLSVPERQIEESCSYKTRWQLTSRMIQQFWKKWSTDYLQQLQTRNKWLRSTENLCTGDVVVIKEEGLPPGKWALGRIKEVHPGKDELVRVVTVRTKDGVLKRPITKLIRLPVTEKETTDLENIKKDEQTKKNRKQPGKRLGYYFCVLLSLFALIPSTHQEETNYRINPFEQGRQIYYDDMGQLHTVHDSWTILTYFNMSTYWRGINHLESYISHINNICNQFSYQTLCRSIVIELEQEKQELDHNNYLLHAQQNFNKTRVKRGYFNGVGNLARTLFGVLDENFAEQYSQDINKVKNNEEYLLQLIKNQTSILEVQNNILLRNEASMNTQFSLIKEHLTDVEKHIESLDQKTQENSYMSYYNTITLSVVTFINKLRRIQEGLIHTVQDIYRGQIDSRVISQEQILKELRTISSQLPKHLSLPINNPYEELSNIYKLIKVKARITPEFVIMELKIPLINDIQFSLYRVIPIPQIANGSSSTVITTSEYVALNILKEVYMKLNLRDLQDCTILMQNKHICALNKPVYTMRQQIMPCEIDLIAGYNKRSQCVYQRERCDNKWIELQQHNMWLYACCEECELRIICQEHMTSKVTTGTGLIKVDQGCTIKRGETTIYTDTEYQNKLYINPLIRMPLWDDLNNITKIEKIPTLESLEINTERNEVKLKEIKHQLEELRNRTKLPETITNHDVHQYSISYITLGLLLVGLMTSLVVVRKLRRRREAARAPQPAPAPACSGCIVPSMPPPHHQPAMEMTSLPNKHKFNI